MLLVYALLDAEPSPGITGVGGGPLRAVRSGPLLVAVEEVAAVPSLDDLVLRGYDATLRCLAASVEAVLPVRFGTAVGDETELARLLAARSASLAGALGTVAGNEQMTVRVLDAEAGTGAQPAPAGESGTMYLARRVAERSLPSADPLRRALGARVLAERCEAHASPPLAGSLYHLIRRGGAAAYREAAEGAHGAPAVRYVVSGPWPAYAFGPEVL